MEESFNKYSVNFYTDSFYQNKILVNEDEEKSEQNSILNNNNCTVSDSQKNVKIKNVINNIESNINNLKKDILNHFKDITEEFNNLKQYINDIFLFSEKDNSEKKNDINIINNSIKNIIEENISDKSNITFNTINNKNKSVVAQCERIEEIFKKIEEFNFNEVNSKYNFSLKDNINSLKLLTHINKNNNSKLKEKDFEKDFIIQEFIPKAESYFGLDNQFEIIRYEKDNHLLIHINNINDLELKLINKEYKIVNALILKKNI